MKKLFTLLAAGLLLALPVVMHQPAFAASPAVADMARIDINSATSEQLQELPGIGEVVAERIIAYRAEHGSFAAADDLVKVRGIGQGTMKKIKDQVTVR